MNKIFRYITTLVLVISSLAAQAQSNRTVPRAFQYDDGRSSILSHDLVDDGDIEDTICVSLLTCSPGKEIYSRFGHTAIRLRVARQYMDVVFNYGCFNFSSDNFVIKFLLGQTDYLLDIENYESFIRRYESLRQGVTEQVLNLSPEEKMTLIGLLKQNMLPENREYRYVWLYDNCTVRARDIIEKSINGKVIYNRASDTRTVRQLLHSMLYEAPWVAFGIDMILGQEIDAAPDRRVQMFLPHFYSQEIDNAVIRRDGQKDTKMVKREGMVLEGAASQEQTTDLFLRPSFIFLVLLIISALIMTLEMAYNTYVWWFDVILHSIQGIAGVIVAFLFFFSEHAGVDSNWLVIMFNPLWILYAIWVARCQKKMTKNRLGVANMTLTTLFLITMMVCKQSFQTGMYLFIGSLMVRSCVQGHFMYNTQKKHRASQKKMLGK